MGSGRGDPISGRFGARPHRRRVLSFWRCELPARVLRRAEASAVLSAQRGDLRCAERWRITVGHLWGWAEHGGAAPPKNTGTLRAAAPAPQLWEVSLCALLSPRGHCPLGGPLATAHGAAMLTGGGCVVPPPPFAVGADSVHPGTGRPAAVSDTSASLCRSRQPSLCRRGAMCVTPLTGVLSLPASRSLRSPVVQSVQLCQRINLKGPDVALFSLPFRVRGINESDLLLA